MTSTVPAPTPGVAPETLPLSRQIAYAVGQFGWSILINIVGLMLVYYYLPPENAGLPIVISQVTFLAVLNIIVLVAASGRLVDAITDPLIASWSDRSTNPRGRRIPFMFLGAFPAALFLVLMFIPPQGEISTLNVIWLIVMQILFFASITLYVTPFFARLPELGHTADQRLNLSTYISITYALGLIVANFTPALADAVGSGFGVDDRQRAFQVAIAILAGLALLLMLVPVFTIPERRYSIGQPSTVPLGAALRSTFRNPYFRYYVVADFTYFMAITIILAGLLFYVTVLLGLDDALVGQLTAIMVIVSFLFYPAVNLLAKRVGKRLLVVFALFFASVTFLGVFFLGRFPLDNTVQAYLVVLFFAVPLAFLGVLPNAVLADIAEHDGLKSGQRKEGMFFAARTLMQKFGQTFGILVFAALTTFGRDPGDDLGIRLSGVIGFVLCLLAGIVFLRYSERQVLEETATMERRAGGKE